MSCGHTVIGTGGHASLTSWSKLEVISASDCIWIPLFLHCWWGSDLGCWASSENMGHFLVPSTPHSEGISNCEILFEWRDYCFSQWSSRYADLRHSGSFCFVACLTSDFTVPCSANISWMLFLEIWFLSCFLFLPLKAVGYVTLFWECVYIIMASLLWIMSSLWEERERTRTLCRQILSNKIMQDKGREISQNKTRQRSTLKLT